MKKVTSLLLALVMALALAVPAFAEDTVIVNPADAQVKNVEASYEGAKNTAGETNYYFTVQWKQTATTLKYEGVKTTYTWDGNKMQYAPKTTNDKTKGWSGSATFEVEVVNQSDASVKMTAKADTKFGLVANPSGETTKVLTTAAVKDGNAIPMTDTTTTGTKQPHSVTYTFDTKNATEPTGDGLSDGKITVATITVTVSKDIA